MTVTSINHIRLDYLLHHHIKLLHSTPWLILLQVTLLTQNNIERFRDRLILP